MKYEKIDMGAYNIHLIQTDNFKTTTVSVNFREKIIKDEITIKRFLFQMLCTTTKKYNTERLLQIKTEDLYSLTLKESALKYGNIINNYIDIKFLNEEYTFEHLLNESLKLLFQIIFNPNVTDNKFDKKTFELVKKDLKMSLETLKEDPGTLATVNSLKEMDKDDPVSYSLWGNEYEIDSINESNLYDYYKKMIKSSAIDIFVVGKFDQDEVIRMFKENFNVNTLKMSTLEPFITYDKCNKTINKCEIFPNLKQSKLRIICKILNLSMYERRYVLPLYTTILGGEANSRLFMNVREKESLAYSISSSNKGPNSIMIISSGIDKENYDKTVKIIKKELENMKKEVTDEELYSAKQQILNVIDSLLDNEESIINYYFGMEVFNSDNIDEKRKLYNSVSKKDIIKLASKVKIAMIYLLKGDNDEKE